MTNADLSRLLWEARQCLLLCATHHWHQAGVKGRPWPRTIADRMDAYRLEQGWGPGFGGEPVSDGEWTPEQP